MGDGRNDTMPAPAVTESSPLVEPSDEELVRSIRQGDAQAGDDLVRRHYMPLMRYLRRLGGSEHLAEDLHQQTWVSVLDHLDRFDPASAGSFKAWLFRIATNKANDHWRSQGRDKAAKIGMRLVVDQEAPQADHRMEGAEQRQKLLKAIEALPENQKQVLLMRYYSGLKFAEIARTLGCPLNTALGRMHKAMMKLKQMMENESAHAE